MVNYTLVPLICFNYTFIFLVCFNYILIPIISKTDVLTPSQSLVSIVYASYADKCLLSLLSCILLHFHYDNREKIKMVKT